MRSILLLLCLATLGRPALSDPKVVLLPLDDRPCNLLFVEQLGRIAGARVVSPPRAWLSPAQPERLASWLRSQSAELKLVSLEMLCYGGLVGSRRADTPLALARERLVSLRALTGRVDLVATLPRLSLLTSEAQAPYERRLAAWAASGSTDPPADVPAEILAEYRFVRQRNLELLGFALDLLEDRTVHRLVVGLDDSAPRGPHLAEAAWLEGEVRRRRLQERFTLLSGADELSMGMLTGWLADRVGLHPSVQVINSDPEAADRIPPLETMPLARMVDDHLKLAGACLASPGDVVLLVLVPGEEGVLAQVERLAGLLAAGRRVAVADLSRVN
ncbi:DUF4127 family protein [bacterium CPR1]|nr:DUF4127 family protein [bacterium CPR1]